MRWRHRNRSGPYLRGVGSGFSSAPIFWAFCMWLCALSIVALLAAPFLGWKVTILLAGFLLVADVVICWFICRVRLPQDPVICAKCLKRRHAQVSDVQATREGEHRRKTV